MEEEIKKLRIKMNDCNKRREIFDNECISISIELHDLLKKHILENNLLNENIWEIDLKRLCLFAKAGAFPKLEAIVREINHDTWSYHFGIDLEVFDKNDTLTIRFDDNDLTLYLGNNKERIFDIIKKYNLVIDNSETERKIKMLEENLNLLKHLSSKLK